MGGDPSVTNLKNFSDDFFFVFVFIAHRLFLQGPFFKVRGRGRSPTTPTPSAATDAPLIMA